MRYRIKIEDQWFDVEIENLRSRPIVVSVEGERFEVWPSTELTAAATPETRMVTSPAAQAAPAGPAPRLAPEPAPGGVRSGAVRAPIPGVVVSVAVQPGDEVAVGQELCVLEAMKMNNAIRAPRAGQVTTVYVSTGQHVKHGELLLELG